MNYREMLDKFKELESRIKVSENLVQSLQLRVNAMEKPEFKEQYRVPEQPGWPREFWPTLWNVTTKDNTK